MKTTPLIARVIGLAALLLPLAAPLEAQAPAPPQPVSRADVSGTLGWLSVQKDAIGPYGGDRWHHTLFGAVGAGWYWTDHWKTEADFGAGRRATDYGGRPLVLDGVSTFVSTESVFSRRILGISQQYQFDRNAWFHPHVAAGANISWERTTEVTRPIVVYNRAEGPTILEPERTVGPRTDVTVRPFVAAGFKAYMTPRGFFRSDLRVGVRGGIDEVLVRFGFGIDF